VASLRGYFTTNRFALGPKKSKLEFESYIGELFREQGYFVMETDEGPDNGVDLVLKKDGEKTYVQCKHWKANSVGVEKVRELLGESPQVFRRLVCVSQAAMS
jgi:HJR/Mrr/RecB family endonuclease